MSHRTTARLLRMVPALAALAALGACASDDPEQPLPATTTVHGGGGPGGSGAEGGVGGLGGAGATAGAAGLGGAGGTAGGGGDAGEGANGGAGGAAGSGGGLPPVGGETCDAALDVSTEGFPFSVVGTFGGDPPSGSSCDLSPTNAVWFKYTASATGGVEVSARNHTSTSAWSRLAIFETDACNPRGIELECATNMDRGVSTALTMTVGTTYLVLFHTDGNSYPMVDPEISITPLAEGSVCADPIDVSGAQFPLGTGGQFVADSAAAPSCTSVASNAVWYRYSPPVSSWYQIEIGNHSATQAYSRLAVFATTACDPHGVELACETNSAPTVNGQVYLAQGVTYLVLFATQGDSFTMVDPEISISPLPPPGSGETCDLPMDVTGQPFPYPITGSFDLDPAVGSSCDPSPANAVWLSYSPPTTDWYQVALVNGTATNAYSRLAIFETTACSPYGAEVVCSTAADTSISTVAYLEQGQTYLILFHTDGNGFPMVNPSVDISPVSPPLPGLSCLSPATVGSSNHSVDGSTHDCWSWSADLSDTSSDHDFGACDSMTGGDVVVAFTTGPAQSTLNYDATISNVVPGGYLAVELSESPCSSGSSRHCFSDATATSHTAAVAVSPSTTYYLWVADGYASDPRPDVSVCVW